MFETTLIILSGIAGYALGKLECVLKNWWAQHGIQKT